MYYIADILAWGRSGHPQDFDCAMMWASKSAAAGSIEGGFLFGKLLEVQKRPHDARAAYEELIARSHAPSMYRLALLHFEDPAFGSDHAKALALFRQASRLGHLPSRGACAYMQRTHGKGLFAWLRGFLNFIKLTPSFVHCVLFDPHSDRMRR